eukprot:scaffold23063_cov20-Prasinocladus_malaysianus.AAC.1
MLSTNQQSCHTHVMSGPASLKTKVEKIPQKKKKKKKTGEADDEDEGGDKRADKRVEEDVEVEAGSGVVGRRLVTTK